MTVRQRRALRPDRLGTLLALVGALALVALPFVVFKQNRIATGVARSLYAVLTPAAAAAVTAVLALVATVMATLADARARLVAAVLGLVTLAAATGSCASHRARASGCCWSCSGSPRPTP